MPAKITREELVAELERLAADLGKTPTVSDVRGDDAKYSYQPYYDEFDSFDDALAEADLEREPRQQGPSKDQLLEAIRELAADIGGTPTKADMNSDDGRYSTQPYYNKFEGWNAALKRAGLEPNHEYATEEELLADLHRVADDLGRAPTFEEFNELSERNATTYARRFGSWLEAREAAGLSGIGHQFERKLTQEQLLEDLDRLGDMIGRAPTKAEIREYGRYSAQSYYRRFGGVRNALEHAGFDLDAPDRDWPEDYPNDWLDRAADVRERDGDQCIVCGMDAEEHDEKYDQKLHVHHVHCEDDDPNALENLVTLCAACHKKWDRVKADPRDAPADGPTPADD